jgi:acyl carrier protein
MGNLRRPARSNDEMETRQAVRGIVAAALAEAGDDEEFADGDSLVVSGRLSSLDVVNMLLAIEQTLGATIAPEEFDPLHFDSVDAIVEMLASVSAG